MRSSAVGGHTASLGLAVARLGDWPKIANRPPTHHTSFVNIHSPWEYASFCKMVRNVVCVVQRYLRCGASVIECLSNVKAQFYFCYYTFGHAIG